MCYSIKTKIMSTTTQAENIDPLLARSHRARQEQIAIDANEAADEAWRNPENIKKVGVDELTAMRISKQVDGGFTPEFAGTTSELSQIIPSQQLEEIRELEAKAKEAAGQSVLPKDYQARGIKVEPITREQIHTELNGGKPVSATGQVKLYDQEQAEEAA